MTREEIKALAAAQPQPIDTALPGLDREKAIPVLAFLLGVDEMEAETILAIQRGETDGDVVTEK